MKKGERKEIKKLLSEKKNKNTEREKTRTTQSQCMQQKKGEHRNRKITRENVFFLSQIRATKQSLKTKIFFSVHLSRSLLCLFLSPSFSSCFLYVNLSQAKLSAGRIHRQISALIWKIMV